MPTFTITPTANDAYYRTPVSSYWGPTEPEFIIGRYAGYDSTQFGGWLRFTGVTVPKGATILTSFITLRCSTTGSTATVNARILVEDAANPTMPSGVADADGRSRYATYVAWSAIPAWTADTTYNTPSLNTLVSYLTSLGAWASGNAMSFLVGDWGLESSTSAERRAGDTSKGSTYSAILTVTYEEAGGPKFWMLEGRT